MARLPFIGLCLLVPFLLSGCGFRPVYAKKTGNEAMSKVYAGVEVAPIGGGHNGQQLTIELEDALNPGGVVPAHPAYRLVASLNINEVAIGVSRDATVSRYNLYFDSHYTLYRNSDGKAVTQGTIRHVGSYNNATNAYFSTYISRDDGIERGITGLSELYRMRLASYLAKGAPEQAITPHKQPVRYYPDTSWGDDQDGALGTAIPPIGNMSR